MRKVIEFSSPNHIKTGFLSNESGYGFILNDKKWKTVFHYVEAMKFEGTFYEDKIRQASTVFQVKVLTRPRISKKFDTDTGLMIVNKVYGRDRNYFMRTDWSFIYEDVLRQAIHAKFKQNHILRKKLLATEDAQLIDKTNKKTGLILEELREELRPKDIIVTNEKIYIEKNITKDLYTSALTAFEEKVLDRLIKIIIKIRDNEKWKEILPGMIEDGIYNLGGEKMMRYTQQYIKKISWFDIYSQMPNFNTLINNISKNMKYAQKDPTQNAVMLGIVIRYIRYICTPQELESIKKLINTKEISINIPKEKRWYRANPPVTKTTKKNQRRQEIKNLNKLLKKHKLDISRGIITFSKFNSELKQVYNVNLLTTSYIRKTYNRYKNKHYTSMKRIQYERSIIRK
ncbi:MAG: NADAR family protein, partial [Romboutsia sp.]|nr:NADAR family protein [Romboutsia sp.]